LSRTGVLEGFFQPVFDVPGVRPFMGVAVLERDDDLSPVRQELGHVGPPVRAGSFAQDVHAVDPEGDVEKAVVKTQSAVVLHVRDAGQQSAKDARYLYWILAAHGVQQLVRGRSEHRRGEKAPCCL
jgi:hypothetical protein